MSRWRRLLAVGALAVGLLAVDSAVEAPGLSSVGLTGPTDAAAYSLKAATLNICGVQCTRPESDLYRGGSPTTFLRTMVALEGTLPVLIAAQEVCSLQALHLTGTLPGSYQHDFARSIYHHDGCPGGFGNYLATAGPNVGPLETYYFPLGTYNGSPGELRFIMCRNKQGIGFQWRACNTHLVPTGGGDTVLQAQYASLFEGGGQFRMTAGDFNLRPDQIPTTSWPLTTEIDQSLRFTFLPQRPPNNNPDRKLDYVFAPRAWLFCRTATTSCLTTSARAVTNAHVDHCYLSGTFST